MKIARDLSDREKSSLAAYLKSKFNIVKIKVDQNNASYHLNVYGF